MSKLLFRCSRQGLATISPSQGNARQLIPSAAPNTSYRAEMEAATANQKLKESEERYRLVLEGSNDGIWDWYCATDEVYCNDRLLEIIGCDDFSFTPCLHRTDASGRLTENLSSDPRSPDSWRKCVRISDSPLSGEYRYCICQRQSLRDARDALCGCQVYSAT